jgi:hypothetical protein
MGGPDIRRPSGRPVGHPADKPARTHEEKRAREIFFFFFVFPYFFVSGFCPRLAPGPLMLFGRVRQACASASAHARRWRGSRHLRLVNVLRRRWEKGIRSLRRWRSESDPPPPREVMHAGGLRRVRKVKADNGNLCRPPEQLSHCRLE